MDNLPKPLYRQGIVAVIMNEKKEFLVGKCRGNLESPWQFPQGGIEVGETPEKALVRECFEEVGNGNLKVIKKSDSFIRYDYPEDIRKNTHLQGQEQIWFLCRYEEDEFPDLQKATDEEFDELDWFGAREVLNRIVWWKKPAYLEGFLALCIDHTVQG